MVHTPPYHNPGGTKVIMWLFLGFNWVFPDSEEGHPASEATKVLQ